MLSGWRKYGDVNQVGGRAGSRAGRPVAFAQSLLHLSC